MAQATQADADYKKATAHLKEEVDKLHGQLSGIKSQLQKEVERASRLEQAGTEKAAKLEAAEKARGKLQAELQAKVLASFGPSNVLGHFKSNLLFYSPNSCLPPRLPRPLRGATSRVTWLLRSWP